MTFATQKQNFRINQGSTFTESIRMLERDDTNGTITIDGRSGLYKVYDLTGHTFKMQIRASVSDPSVLAELSTANGKITTDIPTGYITLELLPAVTAALPVGQAVYDLDMTHGAVIDRIIEGNCPVSARVTV